MENSFLFFGMLIFKKKWGSSALWLTTFRTMQSPPMCVWEGVCEQDPAALSSADTAEIHLLQTESETPCSTSHPGSKACLVLSPT